MLKKSLLLAATAATVVTSFASPVSAAEVKAAAYTDLRFGLDYFDDKNSTATPTWHGFDNHGSYFGFKGSAEQNGLVAFGAYERWLDADNTNGGRDLGRQAYAGVRTQYGTLQFGTFATAYMDAGRKLDPFYATGAAGIGRPGASFIGGQSHGLSLLTSDGNVNTTGGGGFVGNQLAYTSPTLFDATANVAVMFDDNTTSSAADDFAAGAEWNKWGIQAGVQYMDLNSVTSNTGLPSGTEAYRVYGGYSRARWGASASAERIDLPTANTPIQNYLMVSGWYGVMEGTRVAASYGNENETGADGTSFRVGLFYDLLDNFTTNVVYRNFNAKTSALYGARPDDQVISVGATYRFELSGVNGR